MTKAQEAAALRAEAAVLRREAKRLRNLPEDFPPPPAVLFDILEHEAAEREREAERLAGK